MIRKKRFYILGVFIIILIVLKINFTLRKTDQQLKKLFDKKNQKISIFYDTILKHKIRYITTGKYNKKLPTILFVHGAPGSLSDFLKYVQDTTLQKKANLMAIDRVGYGFSDFGKPETSIAIQAKIANETIKNKDNIILVGWSYGGAIIAKMAMENSKIKHIVMLAPAVSPKDEKYFWLGNLAEWKFTKWLVPTPLIVAEAEKKAHKKELEKLEKEWDKIKIPITYFHGDKDFLVPYNNMKYLKTKVDSSLLKTITFKGRNHFIPFTEFDRIKVEIIKILNNTTNR